DVAARAGRAGEVRGAGAADVHVADRARIAGRAAARAPHAREVARAPGAAAPTAPVRAGNGAAITDHASRRTRGRPGRAAHAGLGPSPALSIETDVGVRAIVVV